MIKPGEVYLTRFTPAYKSELRKHRPAVVLKVLEGIHNSELVVILPLSTAQDINTKDNEVKLLKDKIKFLDRDSYVLCWYVRTVDSLRLVKKLGDLPKDIFSEAKSKTLNFLGD